MFQPSVRILFIVVLILSLVALPAYGSPTVPHTCAGLFLSEYIEGSSNNKALELFNGTGAAVDLAAEGYAIEFYFNGSATPGAIIPLTSAIASGAVYVLADEDGAPLDSHHRRTAGGGRTADPARLAAVDTREAAALCP